MAMVDSFCTKPFLANTFADNSTLGEISIYLNIGIGFTLTCILFHKGFSFISKKTDTILGEYSYPLYLLHYQAGAIITFFLFKNSYITTINSKETSFLAIPILLGLCYLGIHLIDRKISVLRDRVKMSSAKISSNPK